MTEINSDPMSRFSGWLAVFYISLLLVLGLSVFSCKNDLFLPLPLLIKVLLSLTAVFYAGLVVFTLVTLLKKEGGVPDKVIALLMGLYVTTVLLAVLELVAAHTAFGIEYSQGAPTFNARITGITLWYLIWMAYFKHSKRVLAYYGQNAKKFKKDGYF